MSNLHPVFDQILTPFIPDSPTRVGAPDDVGARHFGELTMSEQLAAMPARRLALHELFRIGPKGLEEISDATLEARISASDRLRLHPEFPNVPHILPGTEGTAENTIGGTAPADSAFSPESAGGPSTLYDDDHYAELRDERAAERADQREADREWLTDYRSR